MKTAKRHHPVRPSTTRRTQGTQRPHPFSRDTETKATLTTCVSKRKYMSKNQHKQPHHHPQLVALNLLPHDAIHTGARWGTVLHLTRGRSWARGRSGQDTCLLVFFATVVVVLIDLHFTGGPLRLIDNGRARRGWLIHPLLIHLRVIPRSRTLLGPRAIMDKILHRSLLLHWR